MNGIFSLTAIGYVRSNMEEMKDQNWGSVISKIDLLPQYAGGTDGLEQFSHVLVVTYLHRARFDLNRHLSRHPRDREDMPLLGIFSQRAKDRPNPIGITAVKLLKTGDDFIEVQGLDAVNGTPVLDIKPYVPQYDRVGTAVTPPWIAELMKGYF
ncbi:putative S-adenosyl-L-methionine-binding protein MTH_1797 [Candidatus Zixiibacteriota bacterium]|nr:putative S-adenosyl-L-methionine-binding protein MTH_1797 [candidate division Zixibacteria bacterium]